MPNATKYTQSRWLKGADLPHNQLTTMTIKNAYEHTFERNNETKLVLSFHQTKQELALNVTQTMALINAFGPETDGWLQRDINLQPIASQFEGKPTIMISAAAAAPAPAQQMPAGRFELNPNRPADQPRPPIERPSQQPVRFEDAGPPVPAENQENPF